MFSPQSNEELKTAVDACVDSEPSFEETVGECESLFLVFPRAAACASMLAQWDAHAVPAVPLPKTNSPKIILVEPQRILWGRIWKTNSWQRHRCVIASNILVDIQIGEWENVNLYYVS